VTGHGLFRMDEGRIVHLDESRVLTFSTDRSGRERAVLSGIDRSSDGRSEHNVLSVRENKMRGTPATIEVVVADAPWLATNGVGAIVVASFALWNRNHPRSGWGVEGVRQRKLKRAADNRLYRVDACEGRAGELGASLVAKGPRKAQQGQQSGQNNREG
jgi:hypothetical protein